MSKIVWIDMEMTGLDVQNDRIMEIACLITDNDLNVLSEHPSIIIHQPDSLLDKMNDWCKKTHTKVSTKPMVIIHKSIGSLLILNFT